MIVTLDGPSGSGKSTLAALLAEKHNMLHISSGSIYRSLACFCLENKIKPDQLTAADLSLLGSLKLEVLSEVEVLINGVAVDELRSEPVTEGTMRIARNLRVRDLVNSLLKNLALSTDLVVDGRDMGSVVFPSADLKLYIYATLEKRVELACFDGSECRVRLRSHFIQRDLMDTPFLTLFSEIPADTFLIRIDNRSIEELIFALNILVVRAHYFKPEMKLSETFDSHLDHEERQALICDRPTFKNLKELKRADFIAFRESLSYHSHEAMIFRDCRIPFIEHVGTNLDRLIGDPISIKPGPDSVNVSGVGIPVKCLHFPGHPLEHGAVLNSSFQGICRLDAAQVRILATRGEFVMLQVIDSHPLKYIENGQCGLLEEGLVRFLRLSMEKFSKVIYRFSDFNYGNLGHLRFFSCYEQPEDNYLTGNRGAHRLLNGHSALFQLEIKTVAALYSKSENLSVLVPFARSSAEADEARRAIRRVFRGEIGCMIETPLMLGSAHKLNTLFDFFVIGTTDLFHLIQGAGPEKFSYSREAIEFSTELLAAFIEKLDDKRTVYITDRSLYSNFCQQSNVCYLAK